LARVINDILEYWEGSRLDAISQSGLAGAAGECPIGSRLGGRGSWTLIELCASPRQPIFGRF
jgi:hypothetical protein